MLSVYSITSTVSGTETRYRGIHTCVDSEAVSHNNGVPLEEGGSKCNTITENPTPPTQQVALGWR